MVYLGTGQAGGTPADHRRRKSHYKTGWLVALGLCLSACAAGTGGRWIGAPREIAQVDGNSYGVAWVAGEDGSFELQSIYPGLMVLPDPLVEQRRHRQAAEIVAAKLCKTSQVTILSSERVDAAYYFRMKCGA